MVSPGKITEAAQNVNLGHRESQLGRGYRLGLYCWESRRAGRVKVAAGIMLLLCVRQVKATIL
jgi:hypothetical protein